MPSPVQIIYILLTLLNIFVSIIFSSTYKSDITKDPLLRSGIAVAYKFYFSKSLPACLIFILVTSTNH